ncbi:uncharacterized protein LOC132302639 [Cornus florida]|uniref:uncharacterized protein LOC132302639 n=1 Tax=Cornus florida TaxID=4283 RepID=UPI00289C9493|nr:uncharacterized protein LOC132302639 [Cornus florida]
MGRKLDALLGRNISTSKFKPLVNVAVSRVSVLKSQRQARCSLARSDTVQILKLGQHERALLRVEQVIKEQNMLDVLAMIEGYCLLVLERLNLIEQDRVCPDELKEAISSLLYASTRCGEFPELQEMRAFFTSHYGKEFVARGTELRNNCGVNLKMIQKLSTKQPILEDRFKVLKEIASENGIDLQVEEPSPKKTEEKLEEDQKQNQPNPNPSANSGDDKLGDGSQILRDDIERVERFSDSVMGKKKYKDVADAAQAAFESAAYAAAAARAAVELSRSESHEPDDPSGPSPRRKQVLDTHEQMQFELQTRSESHDPDDPSSPSGRRKQVLDTHEQMQFEHETGEEEDLRGIEDRSVGLGFEKNHQIENYQSESEDEEIHPIEYYQSESKDEEIHTGSEDQDSKQSKNASELQRSVSASSSDPDENILKETTNFPEAGSKSKTSETKIVFDDSDDETGSDHGKIQLPKTHDLGSDMKPSLFSKERWRSKICNTDKKEDHSAAGGEKLSHRPHKHFFFRSRARMNLESGSVEPKAHSAEGSRTQSARPVDVQSRPTSVRTNLSHQR